jgi:CRP-like cAMP-binding protein
VPKRKTPPSLAVPFANLVNEKNPFSHLNPTEVDELLSGGSARSFRAGEGLFRTGFPVQGIFCLLEGAVKISQAHRGKNFAVRFACAGDWVGHRSVFTRSTYLGSAEAREATKAFFVPTQLLLRFFGTNPGFAGHMIRQISSDLEATEKKFLEFKDLNVPSRLISVFRNLDDKFGTNARDGRQIRIRISKVEIAELIGASQEVVVRQLSKWKKENLLQESGKKFLLSNSLLSRITLER